jgi:hypothetical protein
MRLNGFRSNEWVLKGSAKRVVRMQRLDRKVVRLPIEPFYPIRAKLETQAIAVLPLVKNSRHWWKHGGDLAFCSKFFNLFHHTLASNKIVARSILKIDYVNLLLVPETLTSPYLLYFPQKYFDEVEVRVWTYRGTVTDDVKDSLLRIEETLNEPR